MPVWRGQTWSPTILEMPWETASPGSGRSVLAINLRVGRPSILTAGAISLAPRLIAPAPDLIQRPTGSLMEMVPQLAVWPVSRKDTLVTAFQRRLRNFYSNPGESNQVSTMTHTFRSGLAGVLKGVAIPFQDLPLT